MSRKFIAAFRTLASAATLKATEHGFHSGDDDEDTEACAKAAEAAAGKLDREVLKVLLAAYHTTFAARQGWSQSGDVMNLLKAIERFERHCKMDGQKLPAAGRRNPPRVAAGCRKVAP